MCFETLLLYLLEAMTSTPSQDQESALVLVVEALEISSELPNKLRIGESHYGYHYEKKSLAPGDISQCQTNYVFYKGRRSAGHLAVEPETVLWLVYNPTRKTTEAVHAPQSATTRPGV